MNFRRDEFAAYYWGEVQGVEREAFIAGSVPSTVRPAWSAWCAALNAADVERREIESGAFLSVIQRLNQNPYSLTKYECISVVDAMRTASPAA